MLRHVDLFSSPLLMLRWLLPPYALSRTLAALPADADTLLCCHIVIIRRFRAMICHKYLLTLLPLLTPARNGCYHKYRAPRHVTLLMPISADSSQPRVRYVRTQQRHNNTVARRHVVKAKRANVRVPPTRQQRYTYVAVPRLSNGARTAWHKAAQRGNANAGRRNAAR